MPGVDCSPKRQPHALNGSSVSYPPQALWYALAAFRAAYETERFKKLFYFILFQYDFSFPSPITGTWRTGKHASRAHCCLRVEGRVSGYLQALQALLLTLAARNS